MDDKQFEARMKKLNNRYDEIPSTLDLDEVMEKLQQRKKRSCQKPLVWLISAASIFIIGVLSAPYLNKKDEHTAQPITEQLEQNEYESELEKINNDPMIVQFKKDYPKLFENLKVQLKEELQLPEEIFLALNSVRSAQALVNFTVDREFHSYISKDFIQSEEQYLRQLFTTPADMLNEPKEVEDWEWIASYSKKINELKVAYNDVVKIDSSIVQAAERQNMYFDANEQKFYYDYEPIKEQLLSIVSPNAFGFFELFKIESYMYGGELADTPENIVHSMLILEQTLKSTSYEQMIDYSVMKNYYELIMMKLFTGSEEYVVKNSDGTYNERFIKIMNQLIESESVTADLATAILHEIETMGQSPTLDKISYSDFWNSVLLQKYPL
ncbi:hypothetical protein [Solibacillus sp. CAU 1738]|uniref:hypothetical protein n=1 Tax=Solibacillus sp. CAU 1738 TaxID=3140363 RepID=UPI0032608B17